MNWDFPYTAECKNCLQFHNSIIVHLEVIEEWRRRYEALEKHTEELKEIIKTHEIKELGYDVAI